MEKWLYKKEIIKSWDYIKKNYIKREYIEKNYSKRNYIEGKLYYIKKKLYKEKSI